MFRAQARTTANAVALGLLVSVIGCSDTDLQAPAIPESPEQVVVDLTGGHFSFLTPLGAGTKSGTFNPNLSPVIEICRLATTTVPTATTPCASTIVWFSMYDGSSSDRLTVDVRKEMYSAVWNLGRYSMPTGYYRIFAGTARHGAGTTFGYSDLAVAPTSREARALAGTGMASATATSDLPIKFRIETGALCAEWLDCWEGSVGPAGGTFVTPAEDAGVLFPAGALPDTRNLVIYRVTSEDVGYCLPTAQPQYEGCYRFLLEPALAPGQTFAVEATVGVCLDPAAIPFEGEMVLQKWNEVDPSTLTTLPRREVEFLECGDFTVTLASNGGALSTLASAGSRFVGALASVFLPQPLLAGTRSPYGGGLNDFSRIGWVRPLTITATAGLGQQACYDSSLSDPITATVTSLLSGSPIAGVPVDFRAQPGNGDLLPLDEWTQADGTASALWTLPGVSGAVDAGAVGVNYLSGWPQWTVSNEWGTASFSATAIEPTFDLTLLQPLGGASLPTTPLTRGLTPVAELCLVDDSGECAAPATTVGTLVENLAGGVYQLGWRTPELDPNRIYKLSVRVGGVVIGYAFVSAGVEAKNSNGAPVYLIEPGRTIPVKAHIARDC